MPNVIAQISNLEMSVERPVILDVVRQVMDITQISSETPIAFFGDEAKAAQAGSTISEGGIPANRWNYDNKVTIEVSEEFDPDRFTSTAVKEAENMFIFRDSSLRVAIKPVYAASMVTITFRYRSRDKNQAKRWLNEIRTRYSMGRGANLLSLSYHYQIPPEFLLLVKEIHRLRENIAGYGEDYNEYLAKHLVATAQQVATLEGKDPMWVIAEMQSRVVGVFKFEGVPDKPEKEGEHDTYLATFEYQFTYDKPIHCSMQYPLVIHQQLLDQHWRPKEVAYKPIDVVKVYSLSALAFSKFEADRERLEIQGNNGITIPAYDEFQPRSIVPSTLKIMTVLACTTPDDARSLFNLADVGPDFAIDQDVLDFIAAGEYQYMLQPYHSVLHLSLYNQENLYAGTPLALDQGLNVSAVQDLDPRGVYRVRLSMVGDLSKLNKAARQRLSENTKAGEKILTAINAALADKSGFADLKKSRLTEQELCELGYGYVSDGASDVAVTASNADLVRPVLRIAHGACDCYGDSTSLLPAKCHNPNLRRLNLVQSLFVHVQRKTS